MHLILPREMLIALESCLCTFRGRNRRARSRGRLERRFWDSRYAQVGPLMALFAGLFTLAIRTWPIATPQGRGTVGVAWFICATIAGACYVAGFFLSDRYWKRARMILVSAALLHLFVGFLAAMQVDAEGVAPASQSFFFDAVPAVVALIAAFLIKPARAPHHD